MCKEVISTIRFTAQPATTSTEATAVTIGLVKKVATININSVKTGGKMLFKTLDDIDVSGRTVLLRVDFNVPMSGGEVTDATRIVRALPTITEISDKNAKVVLLSHFGRPKGQRNPAMSLAPVATRLGLHPSKRSATARAPR